MSDHSKSYTIVDSAHVSFRGRIYKLYTGPKLEGKRHVLSRRSKAFPEMLKTIPQVPKSLYVIGNLDVLQQDAIAVIGARRATPYGLACTELFAKKAAEKGLVIVSGGAFGCDSQAHRAALQAGGNTIVYLGGGCDQIYPQVNFRLFQDIIDAGGAIVSERPWGYPALPFTFPARNRLIAGSAKAVLIVEAGLPSGTFLTADAALNASRDVLVVPGSICSKTSAGSNRLIYQGAIPIVDIESFEDTLFSLYGVLKQECITKAWDSKEGKQQDPLLEALQADPMRLDAILELVRVPKSLAKDRETWLRTRLVELEASGFIKRFPDGRYGPAQIVP